MNREFLKEQGLSDEQIEAVMAEYGKSINSYKEKAEQTESLESQIDDLNNQIKERDEQLEELKKVDAEGLQAKIDELQQANESTKSEYEQQLQQQAFDHSLSNALRDAKVRNTKAVKALLDVDEIKLDGDKLLGLDTQLEALKESDAYLFEGEKKEEEPKPNFTTGQHQSSGGNNDPFDAKLAKYKK